MREKLSVVREESNTMTVVDLARQPGKTEIISEVIRNMKKNYETVEKIMRYTGLTQDEWFKECVKIGINPAMICTEEERACAHDRSRRMYQTDKESDLATAEDRGIQKGKIEVAQNALQMGINVDDIVRLTGLTCEEVKKLQV